MLASHIPIQIHCADTRRDYLQACGAPIRNSKIYFANAESIGKAHYTMHEARIRAVTWVTQLPSAPSLVAMRRAPVSLIQSHSCSMFVSNLTVDLASQGVVCVRSNEAVASSVSVLFICCLPAQLPIIAADIRDCLSPHTIVYSVVTAVPVSRLRRLLGTANVVRPEMETNVEPQQSLKWEVSKGIGPALEITDVVEATCPLGGSKSGNGSSTCEYW
jgi:hypothetical protein